MCHNNVFFNSIQTRTDAEHFYRIKTSLRPQISLNKAYFNKIKKIECDIMREVMHTERHSQIYPPLY